MVAVGKRVSVDSCILIRAAFLGVGQGNERMDSYPVNKRV